MEVYSIQHFIAIAFSLCIACILYLISIKSRNPRITFATFVLLVYLYDNVLRLFERSDEIFAALPFSLCGFSFLLSVFALYFCKEGLFKYTYFFAIGAFIALIAPADEGLYSIYTSASIRFYLSHSMIIFAQIFMYFQMGYRVKRFDASKALLALLIMAVPIYFYNNYFGTNFFFINHPIPDNPITNQLGPWPYYVFWFFVIGLVSFNVVEFISLVIQNRNWLGKEIKA